MKRRNYIVTLTLLISLLFMSIVHVSMVPVYADDASEYIYKSTSDLNHRKVTNTITNEVDAIWTFCLNSNRSAPTAGTTGGGQFRKLENISTESISSNNVYIKDGITEDQLRDIKRVFRYWNDEVTKKDGLAYRAAQRAVWYILNNYSLGDNTFTVEEKAIYLPVIADNSHDSELTNMVIDIYQTIDDKNENANSEDGDVQHGFMQNLITARFVDEPLPSSTNTKIQISKTAVGKTEELVGVTLTIKDEDDTVIETWQTTSTVKEVELEDGTYTLQETAAPEGYKVADAIVFKVENGKLYKQESESFVEISSLIIHMEDEEVETPTPTPTSDPENTKPSNEQSNTTNHPTDQSNERKVVTPPTSDMTNGFYGILFISSIMFVIGCYSLLKKHS